MSGRPLDVLEAAVGDVVEVRLKSGETYTGVLAGYDQHMNLVLEDLEAAPAADAAGPPASDDEGVDSRDTTIIRGDNVVSITP